MITVLTAVQKWTAKGATMLKKYKITYKKVLKLFEVEIEAASKYAAKQVFYRKYPRYEIVSLQEVENED